MQNREATHVIEKSELVWLWAQLELNSVGGCGFLLHLLPWLSSMRARFPHRPSPFSQQPPQKEGLASVIVILANTPDLRGLGRMSVPKLRGAG